MFLFSQDQTLRPCREQLQGRFAECMLQKGVLTTEWWNHIFLLNCFRRWPSTGWTLYATWTVICCNGTCSTNMWKSYYNCLHKSFIFVCRSQWLHRPWTWPALKGWATVLSQEGTATFAFVFLTVAVSIGMTEPCSLWVGCCCDKIAWETAGAK